MYLMHPPRLHPARHAGLGNRAGLSVLVVAAFGLAAARPAPAQNLFAANFDDNTIEEFTPGGVGTQFNVSGDLNSTLGLAFAPHAAVPEASPLALLALGLLPVGLLARKRRSRVA